MDRLEKAIMSGNWGLAIHKQKKWSKIQKSETLEQIYQQMVVLKVTIM